MNHRRHLFVACAVMLGVAWSCSDNTAVRLRYQAEKQLYEAQKADRAAQSRNDLSQPAIARSIRDQYSQVAAFCFAALDSIPKTTYPDEYRQLSAIAFHGVTRLGQLFTGQQHFDSLSTLLSRLLTTANLSTEELASTYYNYGRALQLAGHWDSALVVYTNSLTRFAPPLDDKKNTLFLILNLPLRIHHAFAEGGDSIQTRRWFGVAEQYYQRWMVPLKGQATELSMTSTANLARLYEDAGRWEQSASTLEAMKDSTGRTAVAPQLHIADLYVEHLGRYDEAIALYDRLTPMLQGRDTVLRPALILKQALAYQAKREYTKCREMLTQINTQWPGFYAATPSAQLNKAKCFELEKNWDRAETEYRYLIENYSTSQEALSTYLYLAKKAQDDGRTLESQQWYDRADKAYSDLAVKKAGSSEEALALFYRADLNRQKGNWNAAAGMLTQVFERFPQTAQGQRAVLLAADVYRTKLNDSRTADSLVIVGQQAMLAPDGDLGTKDLSQ